MRIRPLGLLTAACAATVLGLSTVPSYAADGISIDHVGSEDGVVSVLLSVDGLPAGATPDPGSVAVTLDSEPVEASAASVEAGEIERTTILALDASNSMRGARFEAAKAAARGFLDAAPADVQVGLVTFADGVLETRSPTTDHDLVAAAVDSIELSRQTHVYDGMMQSINLSGEDGARSVLVLSDGADTGSTASLDDVVRAAEESEVILDVVSLQQSDSNEAKLARIAEASGGQVIDSDPQVLAEVFSAQADALASQLLVEFEAPKASGDASIEVTLDADGVTYSDAAFVAIAGNEVAPRSVDLGDPLVGKAAMLLGALALGVGLAGVLAIVLTGRRGPSDSERRLQAYFGEARSGSRDNPTAPQVNLKESAVALTDKVVTGDFESRVTKRLAGAGSALTASEWLLLHAGIAVASAFVGFVVRGGAMMIVLFLLGLVGPWLYLKRKHSKRLAAFNAQLAETLTLMAGGLSAGLSLPQAVDTVVREGHEPMAGELKRALIEQRLGVGVEEALDGVAERMESEDFSWVVMAIRIQREVGGNLAELLTTVSDTLREREYLRRQVKVLSAEGRMSAYVLGGLPIAMFIYMLLVRPDAVRPLYTEPLGMLMALAAVVMLVCGFFVMSKIVKVEV